MKSLKKFLFVVMAASLMFSSCTEDLEEIIDEIEDVVDDVTDTVDTVTDALTTSDEITFADGVSLELTPTSEAVEVEIAFTATDDWSIELADTKAVTDEWVTITPMSGVAGDTTIVISILENTTTEERGATATITCGDATAEITITQAASDELVEKEEVEEEVEEEATNEIDEDSVTLLDRSSWTLSASATEEYEGALEYVIDGEFGTYWHSPWSDGSESTDGSSITVNMGSVNSLYSLVMLPRSASQYNTGGIYTSTDGSSWTFVQDYACAAEYNWNYFYFEAGLIEAQYFMFTCENNYGMVDEINAYTASYK